MSSKYCSCPKCYNPVQEDDCERLVYWDGSRLRCYYTSGPFIQVKNVSCPGCGLKLDEASFEQMWQEAGSPGYAM